MFLGGCLLAQSQKSPKSPPQALWVGLHQPFRVTCTTSLVNTAYFGTFSYLMILNLIAPLAHYLHKLSMLYIIVTLPYKSLGAVTFKKEKRFYSARMH